MAVSIHHQNKKIHDAVLTPSFSIIIITRNRSGILGDCIEHLVRQEFPSESYELVVVDDGSTDDTPAVVRKWQAQVHRPLIHYVAQSHRGVNAARNTGIEYAQGKTIIFLDDDELALPGYLKQVDRLLSDNTQFDGVGGPVRDYGRSGLRTCSRCSLADVDIPGVGKRIAPYLLGGNMAIRAKVFKEVGSFDETISGRGDENEWFHRTSQYTFFFDPELWVWHRRDHFTWSILIRHAFIQGLSVPLALKKQQIHYRPKPLRIIRALIHALRYKCAKGVMIALRESGSFVGYFRLLITR